MRVERRVAVLIAGGTVARLIVALLTHGEPFDMNSVRIVGRGLAEHGLDAYASINLGNYHWPYPPGFFPWIALSGAIAGGYGHLFDVMIRLPMIAADAALAWLVQDYLRLRGASDRTRLAAAAVVALGPVFAIVSGYQGQMDSLAILPAVLALVLWERADGRLRGPAAGVLIGIGAALKTVPLLMVIAVAPGARSRREATWLVLVAIAVPVAAIAPFLLAQYDATEAAVRTYHGYPGQGGITLALQPGLAKAWLLDDPLRPTGLVRTLIDHAQVVNALIYAAVAALVVRFRPPPAQAASVLWLATYALAPAFFFQYLIWGMPFFVMAGYLRGAALLQLAVFVPALLFYIGPWESDLPVYAYVPVMLLVWLATVAALARVVRSIAVPQSSSVR